VQTGNAQKRPYFKLYVNTWRAESYLEQLIASSVTGKIERFSIIGKHTTCTVSKNDEYSWTHSRTYAPDAFLFFRFQVEVDPISEDNSVEKYLAEVSDLIGYLRKQGVTVVAVGDYEEEIGESLQKATNFFPNSLTHKLVTVLGSLLPVFLLSVAATLVIGVYLGVPGQMFLGLLLLWVVFAGLPLAKFFLRRA
jgi:hypothetical protein